MLMMLGGVWQMIADLVRDGDTMTDDYASARVMRSFGTMGAGIALYVFVSMPLYIFFATRLSPCFAQTVKDRKIAFFDAWNISHGRFWPILGGYVILAIGGAFLLNIVESILQNIVMLPFMGAIENIETDGGDGFVELLTSPMFLIPIGIAIAVSASLRGLLGHIAHGPAAFAARHDPRGGVDEDSMLSNFE